MYIYTAITKKSCPAENISIVSRLSEHYMRFHSANVTCVSQHNLRHIIGKFY